MEMVRKGIFTFFFFNAQEKRILCRFEIYQKKILHIMGLLDLALVGLIFLIF
jgi:hypothetical protein